MSSLPDSATSPFIMGIFPATPQDYVPLTNIWERAVRATHTFLDEGAILEIRNDIYDIYLRSMDIFIARLTTIAGDYCPNVSCLAAPPRELLEKVTGSCHHRKISRIVDQPAHAGTNQKGGLPIPPAHLRSTALSSLIPQEGLSLGFMGLAGQHIAMLFIDPPYHRLGIGKLLVTHALAKGAKSVDVNEQNPAAYEFYKGLGFRQKGRSTHDAQGNPFPLLHLHFSP